MASNYSRRRGKVGRAASASLFLTLALILAACSGADTADDSTTTTAAPSESTTQPEAPGTTQQESPDEIQTGGELIMAFPSQEEGDVTFLIPMAGNCSTFCNSIMPTIFDPLILQDPETNELVGGLAESWEVSEDGLLWTIVLKDATFHDGEPVTAEDVVFSLDTLPMDDQYIPNNSFPRSLRANVESVTAVDEKTVEIVMSSPQANFAESVLGRSYFGIVPKHAFEEMGYEEFGLNPVGSGPFRFVEWIPGDRIVVERNEDYTWGPSFSKTAGGPPPLDRIVFKYIAEPSTRVASFEAGEINAFDGIPESDLARLREDPDVKIIDVAKNGSPGNIEFNTVFPPTDDPLVRRAIAMLIDRDTYNEFVFSGANTPICTFLEARMKFVNPDACPPDYDPDAAAALLDEAGWEMGSDGVRVKEGQPLELNGVTLSEQVRELEYLQAVFAEAGIQLQITPASRAAVQDIIAAPDGWHFTRNTQQGWTNEDPNILRAQFHSTLIAPNATSNRSRYSNPRVDELLDAGLAERDPDARRDLYFEVQEILAEDVPAIPIVSVGRHIATRPNVYDILPDARGTYRYYYDTWIGD